MGFNVLLNLMDFGVEALNSDVVTTRKFMRESRETVQRFIKGMTKDTGIVRSEGRTLNVGRRTATAEARITDTKGRLLAHATTTCLVFELPAISPVGS